MYLLDSFPSSVLPWLSFVLGIGVSVMQVYINGRLTKGKEEILDIVRRELKSEIKELKDDMVNKSELKVLDTKIELKMENIIFQIKESLKKI